MPSNVRFVAQLFRGGRSIRPRRNFSSPPNNDVSRGNVLERNPAFFFAMWAGLMICGISETVGFAKNWLRYIEEENKSRSQQGLEELSISSAFMEHFRKE